MTDDFNRRLEKEILDLTSKTIHLHTIQILTKGGQFGYEPLGSGVLVKIQQFYFIFSASHVLGDYEKETLYVNTNKGMKPIVGAIELTNIDKEGRVDVAYAFLDPTFGKELEEKYVFLPADLIRKKYDDSASVYVSMGYPVVNIKADPDTKTIRTGSSFTIHPLAKDHVYEYYKYYKNLHYVLEYSGKGTDLWTNEKKKTNKAPHGISGGGLWHISFYEDENSNITLDYRLIGIMFYRHTKYFVHVANNVDLILDGIKGKIGITV